MSLARLTHSDPIIRRNELKIITQNIPAITDRLEMLKHTLGLFYCYYQESEYTLIMPMFCIQNDLYLECFLETLNNQWYRLDRWRLDKYYFLLKHLYPLFGDFHCRKILKESPSSIKYHMVEYHSFDRVAFLLEQRDLVLVQRIIEKCTAEELQTLLGKELHKDTRAAITKHLSESETAATGTENVEISQPDNLVPSMEEEKEKVEKLEETILEEVCGQEPTAPPTPESQTDESEHQQSQTDQDSSKKNDADNVSEAELAKAAKSVSWGKKMRVRRFFRKHPIHSKPIEFSGTLKSVLKPFAPPLIRKSFSKKRLFLSR